MSKQSASKRFSEQGQQGSARKDNRKQALRLKPKRPVPSAKVSVLQNQCDEEHFDGQNGGDRLTLIDNEFPLTPQLGEIFADIKDLYEACEKEALTRFNVHIDCQVLFTRRYFPSKVQCRYIYFTCNFCSCSMSFQQKDEGIVAYRLLRFHQHSIQEIAKKTKADVKQRTLQSQRQDPERKKNLSSESAMLSELKEAIYNLEKDQDDYNCLSALMKQHGFRIFEYSKEAVDEGSYPDVLVMLSPTMMDNMINFGDSIGFEVVDRKLSIEYRVGMFCVYDTNVRLLLGGIAFMSDDDPDTISKAFDGLFGIIGIRPRVIRTVQKQSLEQGLARVTQIYPDVVHLPDLTRFLVNFKRYLRGSEQEQALILSIVGELILQRDVIKAKFLEQELIQSSAGANQKSVAHLLANSKRYIYTQLPKFYFGFNRAAEQKVTDILKVLFDESLATPTFVRSMLLLEKYLQQKGDASESFYQHPIEGQFRDPKIKQVRENVERKIFNKFLENYLQCSIVYQLFQGEHNGSMIVEYKKYNYQFSITNWKCPCYEVERTGIPCSHLILCAKHTSNKSYLELFHKRWLRKPKVKFEFPVKAQHEDGHQQTHI